MMNWIAEAIRVFDVPRPEHFTDYNHCEECAEHDETLCNEDYGTISLEELGNPGWDPLCFCHAEGLKYYMPGLIRLCIESLDDRFYFSQLLFHLEYKGENNRLFNSCSDEQKRFVADFIHHMINDYAGKLEDHFAADDALRAYDLWHQE